MPPTYGGGGEGRSERATLEAAGAAAATAKAKVNRDGNAAARPLERDIMRLGSRGGTHLTDARVRELVARVRDPATPVNLRTVEAVEHLERCQERADAYDWTEYLDQMPKIHRLLVAVVSEYRKRCIDDSCRGSG